MDSFSELVARQAGVVSRAQALHAGLQPHDVRRLVRRRELTPLLPGVFVDHTGRPSWLQRAWAAVLHCAPRDVADGPGVALAGVSALRAADGPGRGADAGPIVVAVPRDRRVVAPDGVRVLRTFDLGGRVHWNLGPPRMHYDEAVLDVALEERTELEAVAVLARAVQTRRTTASRMQASLAARARAPRRDFMAAVLADVAAGTCSVLEREYVRRVERPHGLPVGRRQVRAGTVSGVVYRDNVYGDMVVELDGRLFHDTAAQRDRDAERDLDAAVSGLGTVRLTWGQVVDRPCPTAAKLSALLEWSGLPGGRPCGPLCAWRDAA